jgi:hypothetical protein
VAKKSKLPYYGPLDIDHFIKHRKSLIRPVGRGCNGCLKIINPSSGAKKKHEQRTQKYQGGEEEAGQVSKRKEGCEESQEGVQKVVPGSSSLIKST